jgi:hypothetical protein
MRAHTGDVIFNIAFTLFMGIILCVLVGVAAEAAQEYRSYDARVACEAQRMLPRRQTLSARVVCVPLPTRQDTTTINLNGADE